MEKEGRARDRTERRNRGSERRTERDRERQRALWRDDATATPPQLLAEVSYDEGTQGEQRGRKEKEAAHRPGLFTRNGPINPRDRCYLFIILLNVDRRGAKATALCSLRHATEIIFRNITSV